MVVPPVSEQFHIHQPVFASRLFPPLFFAPTNIYTFYTSQKRTFTSHIDQCLQPSPARFCTKRSNSPALVYILRNLHCTSLGICCFTHHVSPTVFALSSIHANHLLQQPTFTPQQRRAFLPTPNFPRVDCWAEARCSFRQRKNACVKAGLRGRQPGDPKVVHGARLHDWLDCNFCTSELQKILRVSKVPCSWSD